MRRNYFRLVILVFSFIYSTGIFSQLYINEYSASNLDDFIDNYEGYEDWIEIYNAGNESVDLEGYYLSDNPSKPQKWQIPGGVTIEANSFLSFWCSGRNEVSAGHRHTSFKLKQTKDTPEHIVLTDAFSNTIEDIEIQITQIGHSRGRTTDGGADWSIFTNPTLNTSNNTASSYLTYAHTPTMSYEAGFYENNLDVEITSDQTVSIHYTINGNKPTTSSPTYSAPLSISNTTVVNAKAYSSDPSILPSFTCFNTYFINEEHSLSVISASADDLKTLLNGNQYIFPVGTMEYFDENGVRTTFGYGSYNKHGQDSWANDHRSFDYVARDEYGYNYALRHPMISTYTDRDEYQRVILRAAGDDNYPAIDSSAMFRDMLVEDLATKEGMYLDCRKGEKGVVYVNGEFWGVFGFREKVSDADYTKYYYNQDKYNIQYLMEWGGTWAQYGGAQAFTDWDAIKNFILSNDMSITENYQYVTSQYDVRSLIDYIHINSYVVCTDWINWNVGWWRGLNPEGDHRKWGYILWDEDATFDHYINYTGVPGGDAYTSVCYPENLTSDPAQHIEILNKLLDNPQFSQYYVSRYVDLMNTAFKSETMIHLLDTIYNNMAPEMPKQIERWGGSMAEWEDNVQKIRDFIYDREAFVPSSLSSCWSLVGPYALTFDIQPSNIGSIQVNSIVIEEYPKEMNYYGGVNTQLKAISTDPTYEFDYWELDNNTVTPNIYQQNVEVNLTGGDNITAHFKLKEFVDSLVINEINYKPADDFDTKDWIELYNPMDNNLTISNWVFKDDNDDHAFVIPAGTILNSHEYLVLCQDTASFHDFFPEVENYMGNFEFSLSGGGELIRLYDANGTLVDAVEYDDAAPWPTEPDGNGPTLELTAPNLDNALGENWHASQGHGTPGQENSVVGVSNQVSKTLFSIYPNPMKEKAFLQIVSTNLPENTFISIINVFGQEVRRIENITDEYQIIHKKDLSAGIYFCNLHSSDNQVIGKQKLIIK